MNMTFDDYKLVVNSLNDEIKQLKEQSEARAMRLSILAELMNTNVVSVVIGSVGGSNLGCPIEQKNAVIS